MNTLNFSVRGKWTAHEFHTFIHKLNVLYNRLYVIETYSSNDKHTLLYVLNNSLSRVPDPKRLFVDRIKINSPGDISLEGAPETIKEVSILIEQLIQHRKLKKNFGHLSAREITDFIIEKTQHYKNLQERGVPKEVIKEVFKTRITPLVKLLDEKLNEEKIAIQQSE